MSFDTDYKEKIGGATLHFRVRGADPKNPYLLILHGGPGFSAHMFYPWGKSLEKAVNVVYLDQRGCGESERLKLANPQKATAAEAAAYTIPLLLSDIDAVRKRLGVKAWFVLGHSWGGMLGLEYVATRPQDVRGYIHMSGAISVPMVQDAIFDAAERILKADVRKARALPPSDDRLAAAFQLAFQMFGPLYFADPAASTAMNQKIAEALKGYGVPLNALAPAPEPSAALAVSADYARRDVRNLLPRVRTKTLVIQGKQDGVITPKMGRISVAGIRGARLIELDACGHFPFAEQPKKTTDAIWKFVRTA